MLFIFQHLYGCDYVIDSELFTVTIDEMNFEVDLVGLIVINILIYQKYLHKWTFKLSLIDTKLLVFLHSPISWHQDPARLLL